MQDISLFYRKLMRFGSVASLCFLVYGLAVTASADHIINGKWSWRSGYLYLTLGIITLLLTPITGLITFFIYNIRIKQYAMAILAVILLALLAGGTWLIHPDN